MADILTQLQDCLDQLNTQLYASLRYLSTHHPSSSLSPPNPHASNPAQSQNNHTEPFPPTDTVPTHTPDSALVFEAAKRELAADLVFKVKQIEYLVGRLPGVENSRERQEERIRELEGELKIAEEERRAGGDEGERWRAKLDGVLGSVKR